MIKPGTTFRVPTREQFLKHGWIDDSDRRILNNPNYPGNCITNTMLDKCTGKVLTVWTPARSFDTTDWYPVDKNHSVWPVQSCLDIMAAEGCSDNICVDKTETVCDHKEGQTPIFGHFICKKCGTNLRKVGY